MPLDVWIVVLILFLTLISYLYISALRKLP
jgi:hypothetical protein